MEKTHTHAAVVCAAMAVMGFVTTAWPAAIHAQTIKDVTEDAGVGYTTLTITGTDLSKVKSLAAGAVPIDITHRSDTSIAAEVFLPDPGESGPHAPAAGTTVPILVTGTDGKTKAATQRFSYPIAAAQVSGPLPLPMPNVNSNCDALWYQNGYMITGIQQPQSSACSYSLGTTMNSVSVARTFNLGAATVDTDSPTFHLGVGFRGAPYPIHPTGSLPHADGVGGYFLVSVYMCTLKSGDVPSGATSTDPKNTECKNWDGNKGTWQLVSGATKGRAVTGADANKANGLDLSVKTGNIFDADHLVRTLLFAITADQCADGMACDGATVQERTAFSYLTMTAVRAPTARVQLDVIPYGIVYQPPGNESTATVTLNDQYNTNFTLTDSSGTTNKTTSDLAGQISATLSLEVTGGGGQNWDDSTTNGFGTTKTKTDSSQITTSFTASQGVGPIHSLVPGSGETCPSETSCSPLIPAVDAYSNEPFWQDNFLLLIHPQFAVWEQIAGKRMTVMTAAVPVLGEITVADLAACATGGGIPGIDPCTLSYTDVKTTVYQSAQVKYQSKKSSITLSTTEAKRLLALDPFYGVGQGAEMDPKRATTLASYPYGAQAGDHPTTHTLSLANTAVSSDTIADTSQYTSTVTSVIGSSSSYGLSLNLGGILSEAFTIGSTDKTTSELDTTLSYGDSTAISKTVSATAAGTLADADNLFGGLPSGHGPLPKKPSASVFFDRKFGGFMFVDAYAPGPGSQPVKMQRVAMRSALIAEHSKQRFSDVPGGSTAHDAIGVVGRAGWLPASSDGKFLPSDPMTRGDFAYMLAKVARLQPGPRATGFTDVSPANMDAVSISAVVKSGFMQPQSPTTFAPSATMTSQDLNAALAKAFPAQIAMPSRIAMSNKDVLRGAQTQVTRADAAAAIAAALQR